MTTMPPSIADIATRLRVAAQTGIAIAPIRDELKDGGADAAYQIQEANTLLPPRPRAGAWSAARSA